MLCAKRRSNNTNLIFFRLTREWITHKFKVTEIYFYVGPVNKIILSFFLLSNTGNVVADGLVHQNLLHADSVDGTKVFISILNSGSVRSSIQPGMSFKHVNIQVVFSAHLICVFKHLPISTVSGSIIYTCTSLIRIVRTHISHK